MKKIYITLFFLLGLMGTAPINGQNEDTKDKMFPNAVISEDIYEEALMDIKTPGSPLARLFDSKILGTVNPIITNNRKTTPAKSINNNPDKVNISQEMEYIYNLCVAYLFTLEDKYKDKAVEYLKAWAAINVADHNSNIHEYVYNQAVEGYSIIRNLISADDKAAIDKWVSDRMNVFIGDKDLRQNNWGTCLLYQYYLFGKVLGNDECVKKYETPYPDWVKGNLFPNGTSHDLLARDALHYHTYNLLYFAKICHLKAIYDGYEAADAFYSNDINWGASIKKCVDFCKPFLLNPEKNTHVEYVWTEWEGDSSKPEYKKVFNPASTVYVFDELYEMDYDLKNIIEKYRGHEYATWRSGLSALRWKFGK